MIKSWIKRSIEKQIQSAVQRKQGVLLLGPRQTGKTSLLERFNFDIEIQHLRSRERLRFEKDPDVLIDEVDAYLKKNKKVPVVLIDEIQKVPSLLDTIQFLTDKNAQCFCSLVHQQEN
jgi:predicted AAA+ superfamily ATPase